MNNLYPPLLAVGFLFVSFAFACVIYLACLGLSVLTGLTLSELTTRVLGLHDGEPDFPLSEPDDDDGDLPF